MDLMMWCQADATRPKELLLTHIKRSPEGGWTPPKGPCRRDTWAQIRASNSDAMRLTFTAAAAHAHVTQMAVSASAVIWAGRGQPAQDLGYPRSPSSQFLTRRVSRSAGGTLTLIRAPTVSGATPASFICRFLSLLRVIFVTEESCAPRVPTHLMWRDRASPRNNTTARPCGNAVDAEGLSPIPLRLSTAFHGL
jgi:hypothetical protein